MDGSTITELLKQGGLGLFAGIFLWLWLKERAENTKLWQKLLDTSDARRDDAEKNIDRVVRPVSDFTQTVSLIYGKLKDSKEQA